MEELHVGKWVRYNYILKLEEAYHQKAFKAKRTRKDKLFLRRQTVKKEELIKKTDSVSNRNVLYHKNTYRLFNWDINIQRVSMSKNKKY